MTTYPPCNDDRHQGRDCPARQPQQRACTHPHIVVWSLQDDGAPAGVWSCRDCGTRFVPVTEGERLRNALESLRDHAPFVG